MLLDYFFKKFSYDLGIDLGTSNTIVLAVGKGIILNEPTVVAINKKTKDILAIGGEAKKMLGKTPDNILVIRPLRAGVVSDFDIARKVLLYFLERGVMTSSAQDGVNTFTSSKSIVISSSSLISLVI